MSHELAGQEFDIDEFLEHETGSTGRGKYLSGWKKNGEVDVWLSMTAPILGLWQHGCPKIVERKDDDGDKVLKLIPNLSFACIESEGVLRDKKRGDDGTRLTPIERCPVCKFLEWLRGEVEAERVSKYDEVLKWVLKRDQKVFHAGGLVGLFSGWRLTDDDYAEMKSNGINPREVWAESMMSKLSYVMAVVDNDNVEDGVQTMIETGMLGDKLKITIRKEIQRYGGKGKGEAKGHPHHIPYLVKFIYNENAKKIQDKYDAVRIEADEVPEAVLRLIKQPKPDWDRIRGAGMRWSELRQNLEEHCLLEGVPWDSFGWPEDEDTDFPHGANAKEEAPKTSRKDEPRPGGGSRHAVPGERPKAAVAPPPKAPEPEAADDLVECDTEAGGCGKGIPATAAKCQYCGKVWEVDAEPPPPPPKPPMRKRSELGKEKTAAAPPSKAKSAAPPPKAKAVASDDFAGNDEDDF